MIERFVNIFKNRINPNNGGQDFVSRPTLIDHPTISMPPTMEKISYQDFVLTQAEGPSPTLDESKPEVIMAPFKIWELRR